MLLKPMVRRDHVKYFRKGKIFPQPNIRLKKQALETQTSLLQVISHSR